MPPHYNTMNLKRTEYKTIEIAEDESYGMVVGNIVMDEDKMLYAEIVDSTICDHEELANTRAFLDEVEDAMETEPAHNVLNGCCVTEMRPGHFQNVVGQKDAIIKQQSNTIKELEAEQLVGKGCAGYYKPVDLTGVIQKELDECRQINSELVDRNQGIVAEIISVRRHIEEYKEAIRVERIDRAAEKEMINRRFCEDVRKLNVTIEELKDRNIEDLKELDEYKETVHLERIDHMTTLKTVNQYSQTKIKELKDRNIADLKELYDFHEGELEWFRDELSARNRDSEVLKKVVDIAKAWGKSYDVLRMHRDAMYKIFDLVDDCHNTSYTVEMGIRCE